MSTILQIFGPTPAPANVPRPTPLRPGTLLTNVPPRTPLQEEQLQSLIQQLFFQHETGPLRHIGFTAADTPTAIASLCFDVAQMLSEEGAHDIGLIDASPDTTPLQTRLEIAPVTTSDSAWAIAPHLWFVPRQSWIQGSTSPRITEQNLLRLRELTTEFDFSILCCSPVSSVTTWIGRACDGLVLVLTANKTRRLVATQMKEQLRKAQVPLLGTVLTERRFPIPRGLYQSL
jgi:hypothetical protein